jgi:hypothetical protein
MARPARRFTVTFFFVLSLVAPGVALGQEPSPEDRETARSLLIEGRAKMQAKDFQGALRSLKAAHEIMHVPTTGLDYALALEATGQLIEARTLAIDVARMPEKPGEPDAFRNARTQASDFATKLEARIPSVVVTLKGLGRGAEATVTIDGTKLLAAAIGLPRKVNPGSHVVKATATGYLAFEKKVDLREGAASVPIEAVMTPDGSMQGLPAESTPPPGPRKPPGWAYAMGAVGLVGGGVGIGFTVDYTTVKSTVSKDCPNNTCTPSNFSAATALKSRWNRDLGGMGAGFGIGFVGLVTAIGGIAGARSSGATTGETPRAQARSKSPGQLAPRAALAPWFAPDGGGLGAAGTF